MSVWVLIAYLTVFGPLSSSMHMLSFLTFDGCEDAAKAQVNGNASKDATVYTGCVKR